MLGLAERPGFSQDRHFVVAKPGLASDFFGVLAERGSRPPHTGRRPLEVAEGTWLSQASGCGVIHLEEQING